jgi:transcription elongation factor GreA
MMDPDFRRFLRAAQGEDSPANSADPRWGETEALARRLVEGNFVEAALKAIDQEPARKKRWDLLLLTALLREALDERPEALEALEVVADKLMAADDRAGVQRLVGRFLEPRETPAAVRFLHYLARGTDDDAERAELLREALSIRPDDADLNADLGQALERGGDLAGAREHRLRAIEIHLEHGHPDRVGEELLRVVEEDLAHAPVRVGRILLRVAALAEWADAEPLLDLALPELVSRAAGLLTWEDLAPAALRAPGTRAARDLMAGYLRLVVAAEPEPEAIVAGSGIASPSQPIETVSARLPKILALPPGAHVSHGTWGLGRILESDGESITLDFPGRSGHKMSFAMASKSLDRLPGDGLRVLAVEDPGRLRALAAAGDSEVLVRALRDVGGAATAAQLKPRLEAALNGFDWSGYWKSSKDAVKRDRRIDSTEAYRQVYRIAPDGFESEGAALPQLNARTPVEGLGLIRKFLRQHPDEEPRLGDHAGPLVKRWMSETTLDAPSRAQALCYARAWKVTTDTEAGTVLDDLIGRGLRPDDLTLSTHQDALVALSAGLPREEEFLWRALESRLPRLQTVAREGLRTRLGEGYARAIEQRIARGADAPGLAARLIEHCAANPDDPDAPEDATLFLATVRLLERDLPEGVPERLLALLDEKGALRLRFTKRPPDESLRGSLERTVLHWAGSERKLTPVLEALRALGLAPIADEYEKRRRAKAESLLEGKTIEDLETRYTILSRPTYDRLEAEFKRLSLELKTTIPAAIEKARQLGDLRENAEYEAAKLKQANAAARVQELITLLEGSRLLETIEIDPSRVGVGTEVALDSLDPGGSPARYWILGEGDGGLAPEVMSYRAPLAKALLGKSVGAEVELTTPDGTRRYRIASIAKRVPTTAP